MKISARPGIASSLLLICLVASDNWMLGGADRDGRSPRQEPDPYSSAQQSAQQAGQDSEVTVPDRPASPIHSGEQGPQQSETLFAPATRTVTIKLQVEDPNGYFLPNIRRENFVVYEDGVRQENVTVEVEHSPVSIALLMESGGRYHELNEAVRGEVRQAGRQLLDVIGRDDKIAVLKYNEKLETVVDFGQNHELAETALEHLDVPGFSEANFYDALLDTLNQMRGGRGRTPIIVVSTGIERLRKGTFQ